MNRFVQELHLLADLTGTSGRDRETLHDAANEIDRLRGVLTFIACTGPGWHSKVAGQALAEAGVDNRDVGLPRCLICGGRVDLSDAIKPTVGFGA